MNPIVQEMLTYLNMDITSFTTQVSTQGSLSDEMNSTQLRFIRQLEFTEIFNYFDVTLWVILF